MIPLQYPSYFWKTLEMPPINWKINLILARSANCVIVSTAVANPELTISITETKLNVPIVTLSTQDNRKLQQQLKSGFERTINWNNYQSKVTIKAQNSDLDYLIDQSFWGVNMLFVLSVENNALRTSYKHYFVPTIKIKDYSVMIGRNFFWSISKNNQITQGSIRKKLRYGMQMITQLVVC